MQHFLLSGLAKYVSLKVVTVTRIFRTLFLISGLFIAVSIQSQAQEIEISSVDLVLVEAAPNIPWIQRTENTTNVFKGEKFNYDLKENKARFQKWVDNYPKEVQEYKKAIEAFFKQTKMAAVPVSEKDFYYDMQAQYQMIAEMLEWERFKTAN